MEGVRVSDRPVFIYAATYSGTDYAWADYDVLLELHAEQLVGTYDVAVIDRDEMGKVHVHKHEKASQHGAWGGVAVGALCGVLFPLSVLGATAVGGLSGHFRKGLSPEDVRELGEGLLEGEAALVVIRNSRVKERLDRALVRSEKVIETEVDADGKDFERDLEEAEDELVAEGAAAS
jgi:uncharacterized membrane protein